MQSVYTIESQRRDSGLSYRIGFLFNSLKNFIPGACTALMHVSAYIQHSFGHFDPFRHSLVSDSDDAPV